MFHRARIWAWGLRPGASLIAAGLGLGLGLLLVNAATAATSPAPRWIAADAAIYLEVPRPALLVDRLLSPRIQAALRAVPPIEKALEGGPYRALRAVVDRLADALDLAPEELLRKLSAGGMTMAIEGEPGTPPRVFAVVTPDEPDFAARASDALIALARRDAAAKGKPDPVRSAEYRGISGYVLGKAAYALVEGSMVISDRPETLKRIVDRVRDGVNEGGAVADDGAWKERRDRVAPDTLAWGFARLDRLRALDPKKFNVPEKLSPPATFLFGSWLQALRVAPWIEARLTGTDANLGVSVTLPTLSEGAREAFQGFIPTAGAGAPTPIRTPGTIASLSLWRDASAIWEARTDLFTPEVQQGLAKLDTFAGQFFGGRDFGSGVLGALDPRWRLVIAHQDYQALSPAPDVKLPGFALIADLDPDDEDFNQRLKVAFQSFVGLANVGGAQSKSKTPPLELGSEQFEGVTISTAHYMVPRVTGDPGAADERETSVHPRFNFSPSIAQIGNHFILSTSTGLARDLIHALKTPGAGSDETLRVEVDGRALARLIAINRDRLVLQNMLDKGHDQGAAEKEVDQLERLVESFGQGRLSVRDGSGTLRFDLNFALSNPP